MLHWRSVTDLFNPKHVVSGSVLEVALVPGTQSRFMLKTLRARDGGLRFEVADAEKLSDEQVRAGRTAPTVFRHDEIEACIAWAQEQTNHG